MLGAADFLARGHITIKGRMPYSTNHTFLVELALDDSTDLAVYKPEQGERPLWDFPSGLYRREIAAYVLSDALGWGLVPLTVPREGPYGEGSLQHFVHADFEQHYFTLHNKPEHRERFQRICHFDLISNNADRKSGHCLLGPDDAIYAIDNGLTFHVDSKLRTVIWEFAGEPIPEGMREDLRRLRKAGPPAALVSLLEPAELKAFERRTRGLLQHGHFPEDRTGARYPWPPV